MIAKKEIAKLPVLPAKAHGRDEWIGRIRMHRDTLVLDVYDARRVMCPEEEEKDAEIMFRWVCDKKNYYTYMFRSQAWTGYGISYALYGEIWHYGYPCIQLDAESEETAGKFLEDCEDIWRYDFPEDQIDKLGRLEEHIRDQKRDRNEQNRSARIRARQKLRKALPKDWEKWLKTDVYKDKRYLFYNARRRKSGSCAYCGAVVELDGKQKHNGIGKCPACGSSIQYKAVGKVSEMRDRRQCIYLQKTADGFLTRYVLTEKVSGPWGERFKSRDAVLATYNGKKTWYDYCMVSAVGGDEYWDDKRPYDMGNWEPEGYLYTRNVRQAVKDTVFRYAPLVQWMKHERREIPLADFLCNYEKAPYLEFFIKAGLYRLTREYVDRHEIWKGKKPEEILGINRQRIRRLIRMDGGIAALEWLRYEQEEGINLQDETVSWLQENRLYPNKCADILRQMKSVVRMVNYMKKQQIAPADIVTTWTDYLRMAALEDMDITDDIVLFPKDLKRQHDYLVELGNRRQEERRLEGYADLDRRIRERLPEAARYYWENEKYMIVPAAKCEELMNEGRTLHHCVGRDDHYMTKMAEGRSWILFLRKKEALDCPYYTVEINMQNDEIIQWYSAFDRQPDAVEIKMVLKMFKQNVARKRKKERIPVSVAV